LKIIAFYLPQFHEIPENNEWWGKGFTEWTNTQKAKPLFKNHYQPRQPYNDNFYNLLDDNVKHWQIELAKKYGIHGFCFYHYWFKDGKRLLEKPVDQFLFNKSLDFPFCLSWANEPWSRRWDGSEHKIIMPQEYGGEKEWIDHFYYLLPFFKDSRYIQNQGKPIFIIYKPELFDSVNKMIDCWQNLAIQNGLTGISFIFQHALLQLTNNKDVSKFDFAIEFEPGFTTSRDRYFISKSRKINELVNHIITFKINKLITRSKLILNVLLDHQKFFKLKYRFTVRTEKDYDYIVSEAIKNKPLSEKALPGVFTSWDNTPRRGKNATVYIGSTPKKFKDYLSAQIKRAKYVYKKDMLFLNAWNEWAEGAYLEPDKLFEFQYLQAVRDALDENSNDTNNQK